MKIDIHKEVEIESTIRTELLSSMFEVPAKQKLSVTLTGESEHDRRDYNIGLIVGPSGSGKTLLLNSIFGCPSILGWSHKSIIDDFPSVCSMEDISRVCSSVGFNTIPSWLRPYSVLSNGERFRAETARHLLGSDKSPITVDEFTSVVDRQVAQFACHAVQKYVRDSKKKLVVASCHYDIIDWLQPDWILEPGNPCRFTWRFLQPRPSITVAVSRVKYETWNLFKDFHYMSQDLNKAARCYGLFVKEEIRRPSSTGSSTGISGYAEIRNGGLSSGTSNSTKRTDGMGFGFHDDDLSSSENRNQDNLGDGSRPRLPSSGYHGSGGDGEEYSRPLVSNGRSEVGHEYPGDATAGFYDPTDSPETSGESLQSTTIPSRSADVQLPIQRLVETGHYSTSQAEDKFVLSERYRGRLLGPPSSFIKTPTYRIASMCGVLYRPHPKVSDICGFTRMVTLPDFQGLGLAFVLATKVASAYKALGKRLHSYPNHPAWIRSYQRSSLWMQVKDSGSYSPRRGSTSTVGGFGNKRCAVFCYIGDAMVKEEAERLIYGEDKT